MRKRSRFSLTAILPILAISSSLAEGKRSFTSNEGKTLEADLVSATGKEATLKRSSDGKEFVVPLDRLSEDDRKFISEWLAKQKAEQAVNSREAREIELSVDGKGGKAEKMKVPAGTYLSKDGTLTLYPGDEVYVEFSEGGKPSIVAEVAKPERTVTFKFSNSEGMTMLSRTTQMQPTVAMDCMHRGVGSEKLQRTNIRPTEKGLGSFDSWAGSVWMLELSNFEVTDRSADEVYRERMSK